MEANEILKQISLDVFGTNDGFRPKFPKTGESIQEAMERSFKAGEKKVAEWIEGQADLPTYSICEGTDLRIPEPPAKIIFTKEWKEFLKDEGCYD